MTHDKLDNQPHDERWSDLRSRYGDLLQQRESGDLQSGERRSGRWAVVKDRLAIIAVILVLGVLVFLMIDGSMTNFRCTFAEFVTLDCNRWAGEEHPSLRQSNEARDAPVKGGAK